MLKLLKVVFKGGKQSTLGVPVKFALGAPTGTLNGFEVLAQPLVSITVNTME